MSFLSKIRPLISFLNVSAPSAPPSGQVRMYSRLDGRVRKIIAGGAESGVAEGGDALMVDSAVLGTDTYGNKIWSIDSYAANFPRFGKIGSRMAVIDSGVDQTWTKPSDVDLIYIIVFGGGGGGCGFDSGYSSGGGGGCFWQGFVDVIGLQYTIGEGGVGSAGGGATAGGYTYVNLLKRAYSINDYLFLITAYPGGAGGVDNGGSGGSGGGTNGANHGWATMYGWPGYMDGDRTTTALLAGQDGRDSGDLPLLPNGGSTIFAAGGKGSYIPGINYCGGGGAGFGPGGYGGGGAGGTGVGGNGVLGGGGGGGGYNSGALSGGNGGSGCLIIIY